MKNWVSLLLAFVSAVSYAQVPTLSSCPHDENSVRSVLHELPESGVKDPWSAVSKYYADGIVISTDGGTVLTKSEYIAEMRKQLAGNDTRPGGQPEEIAVRFVGDTAIATFVETMKNTDYSTGVQYQGTFREGRVLACENGAWKVVFFSEIQRPNATRLPVESERSKFEDYVGHYRMVQEGKTLGTVTVTRNGDKLLEAWGKGSPDEIFPGGHDTSFAHGNGLVEQFIRDEKNKVVGIHYIFWDDHIEAKRID
jgi:hypothetical protein